MTLSQFRPKKNNVKNMTSTQFNFILVSGDSIAVRYIRFGAKNERQNRGCLSLGTILLHAIAIFWQLVSSRLHVMMWWIAINCIDIRITKMITVVQWFIVTLFSLSMIPTTITDIAIARNKIILCDRAQLSWIVFLRSNFSRFFLVHCMFCFVIIFYRNLIFNLIVDRKASVINDLLDRRNNWMNYETFSNFLCARLFGTCYEHEWVWDVPEFYILSVLFFIVQIIFSGFRFHFHPFVECFELNEFMNICAIRFRPDDNPEWSIQHFKPIFMLIFFNQWILQFFLVTLLRLVLYVVSSFR